MIKVFTGTSKYTANGYVFYDNKEAVIIDAPTDTAEPMANFLKKNKLVLKVIIATHVHWDHTEDMNALRATTKAKVFMHNFDAVSQDIINNIFPKVEKINQDEVITEDTKIKVGSKEFSFLHTPGHTPGSVCMWDEKEKILFSGDTLFAGMHGRIDLPLSSPSDMRESMKRLAGLPKETVVYPGHGSATKIGDENWLRNF
ncbi:MAG: MBL fold metallo-hydrolase [Candidatus Aenigmarchaeota archaeon]|nr:MBL fold metallo-hydrolase [Candidatus Aenigmarchaeota archaeon]